MTLLKILGLLLLALLIMVPLVRRFGQPKDPETTQKLARWIMPLVMLLAVLQLVLYLLRS